MSVSKQERAVTALRQPSIYYSSRGGRRIYVVIKAGPATIHFDVAPDGAVKVNMLSAGKPGAWFPPGLKRRKKAGKP